MADLGLLIERILYFYSFTFVLTTVHFCSYRQLDISSCDLPTKDTVRYTEDQVTMETKSMAWTMENNLLLLP